MIRIPGMIPITIYPFFWLVAFLIGWVWTATLMGAFLAVGVILFSVLFHEFGHALTAVAFGQTARVELAAFGGFTYRSGKKLRLWQEFLIVLNGPLAGFLLALFAYFLLRNVTPQNAIALFMLQFTFVANLFWTVINLIPVLPLDGGHLMSILFEGIFGFRGVKWAIVVGLVIAALITIFFFILKQFIAGALFLMLAFESVRSLRYYKIFNEKDRDQDLQKLIAEAGRHKAAGDEGLAIEEYEQVRGLGKQGILYTMATQELAQIYKERGEYEKAYDLLSAIRKEISSEFLPLWHYVAFKHGDMAMAVKVGNQCYQVNPGYKTALINACAHGQMGHVEAAIGWLECCVREGIPSIAEALARHEFDAIRDTPSFQAFRTKFS